MSYFKTLGRPKNGQIVTRATARMNLKTELITLPCLKNSPVVNCFDSYAMA
jgi:hypothetical protein